MAAEAQRGVGGAAADSDRAAVQRQRACRDAEPVRVAVGRLHDVVEPQIADVGAADIGRLPRRHANRQRKLRRAAHGHRPVEGDSNPDGLRQVVGAAVARRIRNQHAVHRRRGDGTAVHVVGVRVAEREPAEAKRRVRRAAGSRDRAAVQRQRTCADGESVGVAVRRLHEIDEPERGSGQPVETRLPGRRADRQGKLRRAGHVHPFVEGDADDDRLGEPEGVAARRCAVNADTGHDRLAPAADRREGGEQAGGNGAMPS